VLTPVTQDVVSIKTPPATVLLPNATGAAFVRAATGMALKNLVCARLTV